MLQSGLEIPSPNHSTACRSLIVPWKVTAVDPRRPNWKCCSPAAVRCEGTRTCFSSAMASIAAVHLLNSHVGATNAQGYSQSWRASSSDTSACLRTSFPTLRHSVARVTRVARANGSGTKPLEVRNAATDERVTVERVEWKDKREALLKNGVKSISAKEALAMQKKGFTILDVRPPAEFEEAHPEGAVNAAVYRLIKEWTPWDNLRRAGFALFGVFNGTEENPNFVQEVEGLGLGLEGGLIVACGGAGTMKPSTNFPVGKESRSLIAAYVLSSRGYKKIVHMEGGITSWFKEDLPID